MKRENILMGPGAVSFGGVVMHDADGISADIDSATQDIRSSVNGKLDTIKTDQQGKVAFTPCGVLDAAILALLFPRQAPVIGGSVFGAEDTPLVVNGVDGKEVTFVNVALTGIPDLNLSTVKTAFGQAEFTALIADGMKPSDADAFYKTAAVPYASGYPSADGITGTPYKAAFGAMTLPDTLDGWTVNFELSLQPVTTDDIGTVDMLLTDVAVRASCTPLGKSTADILSALPVPKLRGTSTRTNNDLVITGEGGGLAVTLCNAALVTGPLKWGSTDLRIGQLGFVAHRNPATGQLYSVALAAK